MNQDTSPALGVEDKNVPIWIHKWKTILKFHEPIKGTNIIPCKVPLDSKFSYLCNKYDNFYNLDGLLTSLNAEGKKVKMIVDLNQSTYYYNASLFPEDKRIVIFDKNLKKTTRKDITEELWRNEQFEDMHSELTKDITYVKAPLSIKKSTFDQPPWLKAIFDVLDQSVLVSNPDDEDTETRDFEYYILVHCFHGINRTGSVLATYLTKKLGVEMKEAIYLFESARLHKMEYSFTYKSLMNL